MDHQGQSYEPVLVDKLARDLLRLARLFPGRIMLLRGSSNEGLDLVGNLLASALSVHHVSSNVIRNRKDFFKTYGISDPMWLSQFVDSLAQTTDYSTLILDESDEDSGMQSILQAIDSYQPHSKLIICLTNKARDSIVPSALELSLAEYRVGPFETAIVLNERFPSLSITIDFAKALIETPLPIPIFLSWVLHLFKVIETGMEMNLEDSLNPMLVSKSTFYSPSASSSGDFVALEVSQMHQKHLATLLENLRAMCSSSRMPYYDVTSDSYHELGLTPQHGRDPLGLSEILAVAEGLGLLYVDATARRIFPVAYVLSTSSFSKHENDMFDIVNTRFHLQILEALVRAKSFKDVEDLRKGLSKLSLQDVGDTNIVDEILDFLSMARDYQSVVVLESLRILQERVASGLDQRPSHFIAQMDPSNSQRLIDIHQRIDWRKKQGLIVLLPLSRTLQREYSGYFGNIFQRIRERQASEGSIDELLDRIAWMGEVEPVFGEVVEFRYDFLSTIEIALARIEENVGDLHDRGSYMAKVSLLCSEYVQLLVRWPKVLANDDLFVWLKASVFLWDRLKELEALPIELSRSTIQNYCKILNGSVDLLTHSEIFLDASTNYESELFDLILSSYKIRVESESLVDIKNLVGFLFGVNSHPPRMSNEIQAAIDSWKTSSTPKSAVFLFIVDGFSYRHFLSWLERADRTTVGRFDRLFKAQAPLFALTPTLTEHGHVTIVSGTTPKDHGIFDSTMFYKHSDSGDDLAERKTKFDVTPKDLKGGESGLIGQYLKGYADCYLFNQYLKEPALPRVGLSSILGTGMKVLMKIESLPALRTELMKLPRGVESPTFYLVQLPELDSYSHSEGVYRPGSPQRLMREQIMNQYDRFFLQFMEILERMIANARQNSVPTLFIVCADHGMDLCLRTTTGHFDLLGKLGLILKPFESGMKGDADYVPRGIYPRKNMKKQIVANDRLGVANPSTLTGKIATIYLLYSPEDILLVSGSCGCGSFLTAVKQRPENMTCPECGRRIDIQSSKPLEAAIRELADFDFDGFKIIEPNKILVDTGLDKNGRYFPTLFILSKPGFFLRSARTLNDQEWYEKFAKLLRHDKTTPISVLMDIGGISRDKIRDALDTLVMDGYLRGFRIPGYETLPSGYSHLTLRKRPLTGILTHGSASISESIVPLLVGGWFGNESEESV